MAECMAAMRAVRPGNAVSVWQHPTANVADVRSLSKHWVCFFPQHGAGAKNSRIIALEPWQDSILYSETRLFLRGLIHSDGCRAMNIVNGTAYPRYFFSNTSLDILDLCGQALDRLGIDWRYNRPNSISIARRDSVARLDEFIGPKH
jgi:hypothetical protein